MRSMDNARSRLAPGPSSAGGVRSERESVMRYTGEIERSIYGEYPMQASRAEDNNTKKEHRLRKKNVRLLRLEWVINSAFALELPPYRDSPDKNSRDKPAQGKSISLFPTPARPWKNYNFFSIIITR